MKTAKQMTQEVHQAVLGIEGTEDKGLVGDVKRITTRMDKQDNRIGKVEIGLASLMALLAGLGILDATVFHVVL